MSKKPDDIMSVAEIAALRVQLVKQLREGGASAQDANRVALAAIGAPGRTRREMVSGVKAWSDGQAQRVKRSDV